MRFTPTAWSIYDPRIIKKSLKQPILIDAHHDEFVQCVSPRIAPKKKIILFGYCLRKSWT